VNSLEHATVLLRSRGGLKAEPPGRARLERLLQEGAKSAGIPIDSYVNMVDAEPSAFADLLANKLRAKLPSLRPSASIDPQIAALVAHIEENADGGDLSRGMHPERVRHVTPLSNY